MNRFLGLVSLLALPVLSCSLYRFAEAQDQTNMPAPRVFITDVVQRNEMIGSSTSRVIDFKWVAPWTTPRRFVALDEEGVFIAVSPITATGTATTSLAGVISVEAPEFGAYTYVIRLCDDPGGDSGEASSCVRSAPLTIDVDEKTVRKETDMSAGDFTESRAQALSDQKLADELSWVRTLLFARMQNASTSTLQSAEDMRPTRLSPDQLYWRQTPNRTRCMLDMIESDFPSIDPYARERCTSGATSTAYFPSDADIMDGLTWAKEREARTRGLENYATGSPDVDTPLLVGVYNDADTKQHETQPTQLPISKFHILQYGSMTAKSDGHLMFVVPYVATGEYFAGECKKLDCPHGMLAEFLRMKKANDKLRVQMRVSVPVDVMASSTLLNVFDADIHKFLLDHDDIDGFDFMPKSFSSVQNLARLAEVLSRSKKGALYSLSVKCLAPSCAEKLAPVASEVDSVFDMVFIDASSNEASGAHHLSPLDLIEGTTKNLIDARIPSGKIVIDVPLRAKLWSNDGAYGLDLRAVRAKYMGKMDFERVFDNRSSAATLVSSSTGLISYEDDEAIAQKALFVLRSKLGGIRFLDTASDDGTLTARTSRVFSRTDNGSICALSMMPPRNLAENSRGRDVRALQEFLRCRDFIPSYVEVNGNYGSITSAAVKLFQISEGIEPIGTVGSSTRVTLAKYLVN